MERSSSRSPGSVSPVESWKQNAVFTMDASGLDENNLPAYSPTAELGVTAPVSGGCCAFRVLTECLQDSNARENLKLQNPRYRFICWVALCRTIDRSVPTEIQQKCPFQWCDYIAESADGVELLNHVSGCSRFSEGLYNCPYCNLPESFMQPQRRSGLFKPARRHFLRHAFSAIYRLGSKSLKKAIHPGKLNSIHEDRRQFKKRRRDNDLPIPTAHEVDEKQVFNGHGIELDSTAISMTESHLPAVQIIPVGQPLMDATELPGKLAGRHATVSEMEGILPASELASKRFSSASSESALATNFSASSTSSPVSPVTSDSFFDSKDMHSPISPTDTTDMFQQSSVNRTSENRFSESPFSETARPSTSEDPSSSWLGRQQGLWTSRDPRNSPRSYRNIRIDTSCANSRPVDEIVSPSGSSGLGKMPSPLEIEAEQARSPVKFVEELRGLFNLNFKVSYAKLTQHPSSHSLVPIFESYTSAALMFEVAWQAVAKLVDGALPNTLLEVLAIAHLGISCALAAQEMDLVSQLPNMFNELKRWSNAIPHGQDRDHYLSFIQKLFGPSTIDTNRLEELLDQEASLLTPTPLDRTFMSRPRSSALQPPDSVDSRGSFPGSPAHSDASDFVDLLTSLRKGTIVRYCVQYLNLFEHLFKDCSDFGFYPSFIDFSDPQAAVEDFNHNLFVLKQGIIDQLMAMRGVESFRPVIDKASILLDTVPGTTLRDLELYLIYEGKSFTRNQSMYRKFVGIVGQLCNRASTRLRGERTTRGQYLSKDIEHVLNLHHQLLLNRHSSSHWLTQQYQASGNQSVPSTSSSTSAIAQSQPLSLADVGTLSWTDTPTSTSSASPSTNIGGFYAPDLPTEKLFDSQPGTEFGSVPVYQANQAPASVAATGPTSTSHVSSPSELGEGTMECKICRKVLHGKQIYLASNMQRHLREQHRPDAKRLICPINGCGRAFGRNSNLVQHQRAVHSAQLQEAEGRTPSSD